MLINKQNQNTYYQNSYMYYKHLFFNFIDALLRLIYFNFFNKKLQKFIFCCKKKSNFNVGCSVKYKKTNLSTTKQNKRKFLDL